LHDYKQVISIVSLYNYCRNL